MRWRTVRRVAATMVVGLAVSDAAGAVGIAGATGEIYTLAARRRPVPLTGGLDLIPDLTFEELDVGLIGLRRNYPAVRWMESDHPMHHPFHLHGAGRFLVLARDGEVEPNLVWKDTVLVRTGQTVDILFDVSNPGLWMAHCHIAEHLQSGMMFSFNVARDEPGNRDTEGVGARS
jgi:hypothetical protein